MGAYRTLLTHLSQRYSRHPLRLLKDAEANGKDVVDSANSSVKGSSSSSSMVAFDLMVINLADLPQLPDSTAALANFFEREQALAAHHEVRAPVPNPSGARARTRARTRVVTLGRKSSLELCL